MNTFYRHDKRHRSMENKLNVLVHFSSVLLACFLPGLGGKKWGEEGAKREHYLPSQTKRGIKYASLLFLYKNNI